MDIAYLQTEQHVNATVCYGPAVISVRNLNFSIQGPQDAWGRVYREQPLSVSLKVVMKEPFGSSSAADAVAPDTVHYGLLSKAAIATLERLSSTWNGGANSDASTVPPTLVGLVYEIYSDLTGITTSGEPRQDRTKKPFLDVSLIQCLVVTAHLRKASLLGSGVSVTMMSTFGIRGDRLEATNYSMSMRLHELRVPTLIGVNANERLAKQVVVANVEIGHFIDVQDIHGQIEAVVVQTMSDSSYETLEALACDLSIKISQGLETISSHSTLPKGHNRPIAISLEKPTAVVLADAACVELFTTTQDALGGTQL